MTFYAFTAGCGSFRRKELTVQAKRTSDAQESNRGESQSCPPVCFHWSSFFCVPAEHPDTKAKLN
jgi:hypothetical protein